MTRGALLGKRLVRAGNIGANDWHHRALARAFRPGPRRSPPRPRYRVGSAFLRFMESRAPGQSLVRPHHRATTNPTTQHPCPCRPIAARIVLLPMCVPCPPRAKRCRPPRRCCRSRTFLRGRLFRGARLAAAIAPAPKNACPVFGGGGAGMRTGREARGRRSFGATREAGPECVRRQCERCAGVEA